MNRRTAALLIAIVPAALPAATAPAKAPGPLAASTLVVAQVPAGSAVESKGLAEGTLRSPLGEGGRIVRVDPGGRVRVLTGAFHSAADPEISFDGKSILFAAKKAASDPWCVFEMMADGRDPRMITCGKAGARQPVYQSTLYTITPTSVEPWVQVAFVGRNPGEMNEAMVAPNTSLWSCKTDGSALRRLSFNLSNDMDPVILPDGRMIFAGWQRSSGAHGSNGWMPLLGVNLDGTDYQMYVGKEGMRVKQMPTPTASGLVVFVESDRIAGDGSGRLASVSQTRPLHTYRSLTAETDGVFRAPAPLPDGRVLVSWRPAPGQGNYGVYRFDPATGRREKAFDLPGWHSIQAKLLAPRAMPDARSSVVRDDDPEGKLFAVDVNIHDLGDELPTGTAKGLRIVLGIPAVESKAAARRLLGEIPLADDGSFQVQIPANTPVQLQLLDAQGLALRSSAWIAVRNHAAQGCVGCHEDPERTPPNRLAKALSSPAPVLNAPPEKRRLPSYADLKPILDAKCSACHGTSGIEPRVEAGLDALSPFIKPGEARRSPLIWHLVGRSTARPWDAAEGSVGWKPVPGVASTLSAEEVRAFVEWIDLGGQP